MEEAGKRKRSNKFSEERLFKKFEVLESKLMELWENDSNRGEDSNTTEPLDAGDADIISFINEQVDEDQDLDEEVESFNEHEQQFSDEEEDEGNFNGEESFIEELPRESRAIEEIYLSDDETTNTWEDPMRLDDDSQSSQIDHDVILVNEQETKLNGVSLNVQYNGVALHPDISETWTVWTRSGIPYKDKQELFKKYAPPKFLKAPEINQQIQVTLHKRPIEKDDDIRKSQEILSSALTALGSTMSALLSENDKSDRLKVLNNLNDTAKLLTELFHFETQKRRSNIISWKPQQVQAFLVGTKPDEYLFGRNLNSKIREAQQSGKIGELKPYVFKKNNNKPYRYFPSPYHWFGSKEEETETETQNFVLNPMKQESKELKFVCKKEELGIVKEE